jgi:hypothetical protein
VERALRQPELETRDALRTREQTVEGRNAAQHFVAQESEILAGLARDGLVNRGEALPDDTGLGSAHIKQAEDDEDADGNDHENEK